MTRQAHATSCEILKALRSRWMTRDELRVELQQGYETVKGWVEEFVDQGICIKRSRALSEPVRGLPPAEYTISPEWGGSA